jgi:hypothetical protein
MDTRQILSPFLRFGKKAMVITTILLVLLLVIKLIVPTIAGIFTEKDAQKQDEAHLAALGKKRKR